MEWKNEEPFITMQLKFLMAIKFKFMVIAKYFLMILFLSCNSPDKKSSSSTSIDSSNLEKHNLVADSKKDYSNKIDTNLAYTDSIEAKKKILALMQGLWKQTESGEQIQITGDLFITKFSSGKKDSLQFFISKKIKSGNQDLKIPDSEKNSFYIYFNDNDQYNYYYLLSISKIEMHLMYSNGQTVGYRHISK